MVKATRRDTTVFAPVPDERAASTPIVCAWLVCMWTTSGRHFRTSARTFATPRLAPTEAGGAAAPALDDRVALRAASEHALHRRRELRRVVGGDEHAGIARGALVGARAHDDDGTAARHRLEDRQPEALALA